jgi:hypothetical protein
MLEFEREKSTYNVRSHIRVGEDNWIVSKRAKYSRELLNIKKHHG